MLECNWTNLLHSDAHLDAEQMRAGEKRKRKGAKEKEDSLGCWVAVLFGKERLSPTKEGTPVESNPMSTNTDVRLRDLP